MTEQDREQGVPPDPSGIDEPHDVLAAEEFGIGTRDERYPVDPSGIEDPHDVLAAEEFAMPAPGSAADRAGRRVPGPRAWVPLVLLAGVALALLRRRRS